MDDIIYIQGSDAYAYLQEIDMLDDEDDLVALPMSLGDELSFMQEQIEQLCKQKRSVKCEQGEQLELMIVRIWGFELIGLKFRFWLSILMILLVKMMVEVTVWDFVMFLIGVACVSKVVKETNNGNSQQNNSLTQLLKLLNQINELILQKSKDGLHSPKVHLIWQNTLKICCSLLKVLPAMDTCNLGSGEFLDCVTIYRRIYGLNRSLSKYYYNCFVDTNKSISFWELIKKTLRFNQFQMQCKFSLKFLRKYYEYVFDENERQLKGNEIVDEMNEGNVKNQIFVDALVQQLAHELYEVHLYGKEINKENLKSIIGLVKLEIIFKAKNKSEQFVAQIQEVKEDRLIEEEKDEEEEQRRRRNHFSFSISSQDEVYQIITPHQKNADVSILKQKLDHMICMQEAKGKEKDGGEDKKKIEKGFKGEGNEEKYEKRREGFGLVIGLPKPKQIQSFYLE